MSNLFSLDDLRSALDQEFAPLKIQVGGDTLVLSNLMRVPEKARNEALAALDVIQATQGEEGEEEKEQSSEDIAKMSAAVTTVLRNVTAEGKGDKLVEAVDGDLMLAMKIVERWTEATQPGEAESSPS